MECGRRLAIAALVSLAFVPAALADDGTQVTLDPMALAEVAIASMPQLDPATAVADLLPVVPPAVASPPTEPIPVAAPETVPAAAAEPNSAMEPHPSPPPAQSEALGTTGGPLEEPAPISAYEVLGPAAEPHSPSADVPQYQPEPAQYQPPSTSATAESAPAAASASAEQPEQEWNWDWTWSCGGSKPATAPPPSNDEVLPKNWNWNWAWNCDPTNSALENKNQKSNPQYQQGNTRYHPLNVNVSIRIASPGDDGPVTQTSIVFAVSPAAVSAGVQAEVQGPLASQPSVPAAASQPAATEPTAPNAETAKRDASPKTTFASPGDETRGLLSAQPVSTAEASSWTARPVVSKRLQSTRPEAHRASPELRRPTRRPLSPRRAPAIPVGSAGAAPLGGSDGGGFQIALLLVPFAFALVDSARRSVRDITPPVARAYRSRRERPG